MIFKSRYGLKYANLLQHIKTDSSFARKLKKEDDKLKIDQREEILEIRGKGNDGTNINQHDYPNAPEAARVSAMAKQMPTPSFVLVPRPSSSTITRLRGVTF